MDTFQLIALIIVALVILAVIIAFRKRIVLTLKGWGFDLGLEAENEPRSGGKIDAEPAAGAETKGSAGVRAKGLRSEKGGIYIEEGRGHGPGGVGVEATDLDADGDLIIGRGEGGDPKAPPPA